MFEIGASLREARERRRLGYDQVEAETKIRTKYVRCLEDEQFEVLPSGTYVKGFLRTYADYLGLDGQLYVDEYVSRYGDGHDEVFPRRRERPQVQRRESSNAVLLALAGIVALFTLFVVAWRFGAEEPPPPPTPVVTTTGAAAPEQTEEPASIENAGLDEQLPRRNVKKAVPVKMKILVSGEASWLVVRRLDGRALVNTTVPEGEVRGPVTDPKGFVIDDAGVPAAVTVVVNAVRWKLVGKGPWRVTPSGVMSSDSKASGAGTASGSG